MQIDIILKMGHMDFNSKLKAGKKKIVEKWFDATINTYPYETAKVLGQSRNRFDNPVGVTTYDTLDAVFDQVTGDADEETLESTIDPVVRIRAVQSFTAAKAVGFVFDLKQIVADVTGAPVENAFDRKVDKLALATFNRFMKCREDIFLLKATEAKRRIHGAFERAGLVAELSEEDLLGSNKQ